VEVTAFTTLDTDTGTLLFAIFEKDELKRRFISPRNYAVQKGMISIIEKEYDFWSSLSYEYDAFSVCKDK
jgi:hypothetical protein